MPIEVTPATDPQVIISHTGGGPKKDRAGWEKWLPPAAFIGFSAFVIAAELTDWLHTESIIKHVLELLAGGAAALATTHSGLFRQGRRK